MKHKFHNQNHYMKSITSTSVKNINPESCQRFQIETNFEINLRESIKNKLLTQHSPLFLLFPTVQMFVSCYPQRI